MIILDAFERIPRRFAKIKTPDDFVTTQSGIDLMDSICMVLIATGEEFKKIDRETEGKLFANYPQITWRGAIGLRDVLSHGYFQIDPEQLYTICKENIPPLIETMRKMIKDLEDAPRS
ncbi:MAG: hypothetical protein BroJett021_37680 [Chloroflexota bacterium]|nr:MAG: hypothetical protein BroJett021_37680 [Chloroflexota bacterium]